MEKSRISHAAFGWLIACLLAASSAGQDIAPEPLREDTLSVPDTSEVEEGPLPDSTWQKEKLSIDSSKAVGDTSAAVPQAVPAVPPAPVEPSLYERRPYLSRGVSDEIKPATKLFVVTPGTIGSPRVPVEYLNIAGAEVTVNRLPFLYNGLYRPYLIGTDPGVLPWEILSDYHLRNGILDFTIGFPHDAPQGSDVEVARGPYGYNSTRWRFYQSLNSKTRAYFTVGFKKAKAFYTNSDYNGYHVAGGVSRSILGGKLNIDMWKHRARAGLLSFDFLVSQLDRQSRGIDRGEVNFDRKIRGNLKFALTGLYQRSAQTITGYAPESKTKEDIGGGKGKLYYDANGIGAGISSSYYNTRLYGLSSKEPSLNIYEHRLFLNLRSGRILLGGDLGYSWSGTDEENIITDNKLAYSLVDSLSAYISFSRDRRFPDLYLLYYGDEVAGLGYPDVLETYRFSSNPGLKSPVSNDASFGVKYGSHGISANAEVSLRKIERQIRLLYSESAPGSLVVAPVNFDDQFVETTVDFSGEKGPVSLVLTASYRKWKERYFAGGLEKGPSAVGFAALSFERRFFIDDLYLGASIETQASTRRDYRSIQIAYTDAFIILNGRFIFRYKDFAFYLNEDNLSSSGYYPLPPYPGTPRNVWWGFRWRFFG